MQMNMEAVAIPGLPWSWRQLGGILGIVGTIVFIVGILMTGDTPQINDTVEETIKWYQDNGKTFLVGDFIIGLGIILGLFPFMVAQRHILGRAEGEGAPWSTLAFVGALLFFIATAAGSTFGGALAVGRDVINDEQTIRLIQYADFYTFNSVGIILSLYFFGTAMVILKTGALWKWLAWLDIVLAVLAVVSAASPIDGDPDGLLSFLGFIDFIGFGVTILAVSTGMLMNKTGAAASA